MNFGDIGAGEVGGSFNGASLVWVELDPLCLLRIILACCFLDDFC